MITPKPYSARNRSKLWTEINGLLVEIAVLKTGKRKVMLWEVSEAKKFWLNVFGCNSLGSMNTEELDNFKALLEAKIKGDYKRKSFRE